MQRKLNTQRDRGGECWRVKLTASLCGSSESTHWLSGKVCGNAYITLGWIVRTTSQTLYFILYIFLFPPPREHEACIRDLSELRRQLALGGDKLDQAREKLAQAKVLNQRLHQETGSAKAQIAMVKASLELQRGIISGIKVAQAEVRRVASQQTGFGLASHFFGLVLDCILLCRGLIFCL